MLTGLIIYCVFSYLIGIGYLGGTYEDKNYFSLYIIIWILFPILLPVLIGAFLTGKTITIKS